MLLCKLCIIKEEGRGSLLLKNHIYKVNEIYVYYIRELGLECKTFWNVVVGNTKDLLVFFPAQDQNFSSPLRFNEMKKKIPTKSKHIESNFKNKADILSWMFSISSAKNRRRVLKTHNFALKNQVKYFNEISIEARKVDTFIFWIKGKIPGKFNLIKENTHVPPPKKKNWKKFIYICTCMHTL